MRGSHRVTATRWIVAALLVLALAATGCKKGDDDPIIIVQPDVGGTHYYVADIYGDLINAQINVASGLYSYLQLEGPTPLGVGQGALIPASGLGAFAFYDEDDTMWALKPDKLAAMGGDGNVVFGVPVYSSTYTATAIAGMYNWLSLNYFVAGGSYTADYGTLLVNDDGTWEMWSGDNGTTTLASPDDTGTWTDRGNGLLTIVSDGFGCKIGNVAFYLSGNDNILVMNYIVSTAFGPVYGMNIGLPQAPLTSGQLDGFYDAIGCFDTDFVLIEINGTDVTVGGGSAQSVNLNDPWDGIMFGSDFYVIGSQDGFTVTIVDNFTGDDEMIISVKQ